MSNFGSTYWGALIALEDFYEIKEKKRQALLSTIALAEARLTKPEYFGFLIKQDRLGFLEALSQTKTIFRGLNPHDPLDGMVINGKINPDFILMLEKNFFKVNSKNLDRDEWCFVRYKAQRNKKIAWLKNQFKELSLNDDEYFKKEFGVSQEELFQRLRSNEWIWSIGVDDKKLSILDGKQYLEELSKKRLLETCPKKFCRYSEAKRIKINIGRILEECQQKQQKEKEERSRELWENRKLKIKASIELILVIIVIIICIIIIIAIGF